MNYSKLIYIFFLLELVASQGMAQKRNLPLPNKQQIAWQHAELGFIFHYDLHVFDGRKYQQAENRIKPVDDYNIFSPSKLDVEQWVIAAKSAGANFALLTATHETGFALYQSDVNPYCLKAVRWRDGKADLVRDFVDACRKHNIKPGIYLGIRWNSFFGVHDFKVVGDSKFQDNRQAYYNKMVEGMVTEICTRYGPLFEIWFDGGASHPAKGAPDILPIVKKYQPDCLFYHNEQLAEARWGGSETGTVGYPNWSTYPFSYTGPGEMISKNGYALLKHGDSLGNFWVPAMADAPLRGYNGRHEWFWEPNDEQHIYPVDKLMDMYCASVGRNATLIVGLTPDTSGLLPLADVQRLKEWGEAINRRFSNPLASISGKGRKFEIRFPKVHRIHQVVISEDIALGHRIKNFRVQAFANKRWETLGVGSAVGNKYILSLIKPVQTKRVRLLIDQEFAEPVVTDFSIY